VENAVRALVVSDLHANAEALRAVLSHVRRKKFDRVICLGDFVGYGAQPNQVLDSMRMIRKPKIYIRGNHDRVAAGVEEGHGFNQAAREAALWTRDRLSPANRRFLRDLPLGPVRHKGMLICHGSPFDEDEYLFSETHAARIFMESDARLVLFGHTHLPAVFWVDDENRVWGEAVENGATIRLEPTWRYLINPGSVGQPRDRNPEASFAIVDTRRQTAQFFRVPYDVVKTQTAILRAGLPSILAYRLTYGT
jgi:predicted phosphodiesterase